MSYGSRATEVYVSSTFRYFCQIQLAAVGVTCVQPRGVLNTQLFFKNDENDFARYYCALYFRSETSVKRPFLGRSVSTSALKHLNK